MDEGSVADDVQFANYFSRFVDIFTQPTADTLMVGFSFRFSMILPLYRVLFLSIYSSSFPAITTLTMMTVP